MKHSARVFGSLVFSLIAISALSALAAAPAAADVGPTYAIRGCRIVPVAGPVIEKGTIVIRDGLIERRRTGRQDQDP